MGGSEEDQHSTTMSPGGSIFGAPNLSNIISSSLSTSASPQLKHNYDAISVAAHASMIAVGFRLIGLGEDHKIDAQPDRTEPTPLPAEWNATKGSYAFRYAHSQSSMEYLLKINSMGNKAVIMGMGMGDDRTYSFDVKADEFVSTGNLPVTLLQEGESKEDATRKIGDVFISIGRLSDFGSMMRLNIIQKLVPSLQKEGYEETQEPQSSSTSRQPRDPADRDLYPPGLGPKDPLRGGVGPGFGGGMGGGGMHPTFDDPLFQGQGRGGGGFDPQAPPGSRYDPVGPGMGGPPRGAGMGGRPPNPFGGFGGGDFI